MALNRNLRPRVRRLPSPPKLGPEIGKPVDESNLDPPVLDVPLTTERQFSSMLDDKADEIALEIDAKEREKFLEARKSLLEELDGVFRLGVDSTLTHSTDDGKASNHDYSDVKRNNYAKAVLDYEAAGKNLADSGLYSNASICFGCMIVGKFLATSSLSEMYDEFQKIVEQIQHKQIIRSNFFSILTQIFEAIAIKDKKAVARQLERLKLVETFSTDDQELIADAIDALTDFFAR